VGLSLDEIARILQDKLNNDELRGMLKAQLILTESDIKVAQLRRERILAHLNHLILESNMPTYDVTLKSVEVFTVATIRETIPKVEHLPRRLGEMFNMIAHWLKTNRLAFSTPITIYHNENYTRENVDTECAFIITNPESAKIIKPDNIIVMRQMKAIPHVATTVVADNFFEKVEGLTPAYHAVGQWIEDNSYRIVGPPRELLHGSSEGGDLTAEIQFPVEKSD